MHTRKPLPNPTLLALAAIAAAAAVMTTHSGAPQPSGFRAAATGLAGDSHPQVTIGQRRIVVLRTPSVAQRLAITKYATGEEERQWTAQAYAAQQEVLQALSAHGLGVRPDYSYARVLDGFAASLDPRAVAFLETDPDVAGVYPVRAAFPASVASGKLEAGATALPVTLPGFDGRGVQIALLDTGVDRSQPYLGGRVEAGIDVVGTHTTADAQPDPQDPTRIERHGTELAGLLVGSGGPGGIHGAAPGATVLPIRVAGWQPASSGGDAIYARTDQLIAGLDRAVDPNGDGDVHDAVRIALIGVSEPYAAFADSPEAQAVAGALALDTLVIAPAGNDGAAGPAFGSIGGPGGSPAALTVAALDPRTSTASVRVTVWRGLDTIFDAREPLLGTVAPTHSLDLSVGIPRGTGEQVGDWFDGKGLDLVAGRAALIPAGADPGAAAVAASQAGARAVLVPGNLSDGALGLSSDVAVPVVAISAAAARAIAAAREHGAGIAIGGVRTERNMLSGQVAAFSSRGLAFDGAIKPDLTAPGVALATSDPGTSADGEPAFATVNGTSAAAAAVAGAAAVLIQARPALSARQLASLLAGSARKIGASLSTGGAGLLDVGASVAAELAASVTSLSFASPAAKTVVLWNVSTRRLVVNIPAESGLTVSPQQIVIRSGRAARIRVAASAPPGTSGELVLAPSGGEQLRVPWVVPPSRPAVSLIRSAILDTNSFSPSDLNPAVLVVQAGSIDTTHGLEVEPVSRLDVLLYTADGSFVGLLTRERDLLPGTYSFGITGRSPSGAALAPGHYELRLVAWPTAGGAPSRFKVRFAIQ